MIVNRPDGAEIAWYDEGSGSPVLLITGLAYPAASWRRQVPVFAQHHRVISIDNRGAGGSTGAPGAPYTVELMADDCVAVLDAAGVESAHVVGISMGGLMAQELGLSHPNRVQSLALVATHPGSADGVWPQDVIDFLGSRLGKTADERLEMSIPFNYAPTTPRARIEQDWQVRLPGTADDAGYAAQQGTSTWAGLDRLPSLTVPTLVLHGADDRLVVPANGERIAAAIPDAKLVLVEGANHLLTTDRTDEVNSLLLDWFGEHE